MSGPDERESSESRRLNLRAIIANAGSSNNIIQSPLASPAMS